MTHDASTRTYQILAVRFEPEHIEETREYEGQSLSEALQKAQRADAGHVDYTYGIQPDDYATAREEGIAFNEADGLLM